MGLPLKANGIITVLLFYKNSNKNFLTLILSLLIVTLLLETLCEYFVKQVVSTTKKCWTTLCTNQVIEDVEERMENNPSTSLTHLSQEVGLSVGTCHKIVKKTFFCMNFMPITNFCRLILIDVLPTADGFLNIAMVTCWI
ncbi:hypothetical protein Zmor_026301 [Zophobas morio]|uniref:Uncharacterized protein n=1 Tax=Zophobas morio TaxID=2755281 RepID=A0AA38HTF0_9CUCU|nr:hypothetical protein Zmor_026301 [Zophobas morio]